jgi:hypothetical protein
MTLPPTHTVAGTGEGVTTRAGAVVAPGTGVTVIAEDGAWVQVAEADGGVLGWIDGSSLEPAAAPPASRHPAPPPPGASSGGVAVRGVPVTSQLVGGALILVGSFLPWTSQFFTSSHSAFGVGIDVLVDPRPEATGAFKIGLVLLVLGAVVVGAGLHRLPMTFGNVAGGVAALVAVVFVAQLQRGMGKFYAATVFGVLGIGVYLTVLGGMVAAVAKGPSSS